MPQISGAQLTGLLQQQALLATESTKILATMARPTLKKTTLRIFGDRSKLADLAQATQLERARLGYVPNRPLVRNGDLRKSVEAKVMRTGDGFMVGVGSSSQILKYHEFGYVNARTGRAVPPRPVFQIGMREVIPEINKLIAFVSPRLLDPNGPSAASLAVQELADEIY